ncbi:transposase InsO family protein [Bacillus sp. 3255]|nr:transposase InsO family protein [Bacillus sp. 3255]
MSRRGNCLDNAVMESFFSHLKAEALYPYDIRSIEEARQRIEAFIQFYNEERIPIKAKQADTDRVSAPACRIGLFFNVYNLGS